MRKEALILILAIVFLTFGGVFYYYNNMLIPKVRYTVEQKVKTELEDSSMPKVKVAVVVDSEGISKYTVLTSEILNEKIKMVDVPVKYAVKNGINDIVLLEGKITKEDLRFNEQIVSESLSLDTKWFGEYERLKEYSISNTVAGEVKTGNIIDLLVNYDNGDYDVVVPKIKVHRIIEDTVKSEGSNKNTSNNSSSTTVNNSPNSTVKFSDYRNGDFTIILAVDEEQYKDLELAGKLGKLETRLYLDESQPASTKTFEYISALSKIKLTNVSEKSNGSATTPVKADLKEDQSKLKLMN